MGLYIEDLPSEAIVKLSFLDGRGGSPKVWKSWIQDDFSLQGSSSYNAPLESLLDDTHEKVQETKAGVAGVLSYLGVSGDFLPTFVIKNIGQTVLSWSSSERPSFSPSMLFIDYGQGENIQEQAVELASLVYPRQGAGQGTVLERLLDTPGSFGVTDGASRGTFTLRLGSWFVAPNLVLESAQLDVSKERTTSGQPLWAKVECSLRPYKLITESEFQDYFRESPRVSLSNLPPVRTGIPS